MNIITEYRKARADGMTAQRALQSARYNVRMAAADYPRYVGDDVTIDLPRGESIVMRLEYDDSPESMGSRFGVTIEHGRTEHHYHAPDWWQDRQHVGRFYVDLDRRDYAVIDVDAAGPEYYSARGMSRHVAWLAARRDAERIAAAIRDARDDGYVGYVVELRDAAGDVIEDESVRGFDDADYAGSEAYDAAQRMAQSRAAWWADEVTRQRERAASVRASVRAILADMRKLRDVNAPAACSALRDQLRTLRASHGRAMAIVGGAA